MPIATQEILNAVYDQTNNLLRTSLSNGGTINGNVTIPNPNTLTLGAMTQGSVIFVGTGGVLSQNNANLSWNNATTTFSVNTLNLTSALGIGSGGTGAATFTSNGVLYGNGASAIQATSQGSANTILTANAGAPSFSANPTIGTSVTVPTIIGGTAVGSSLNLQSTSGVGTTDFIRFLVGNNGGTEAARITTAGNVGIGTTNPGSAISVVGAGAITKGLSVGTANTAGDISFTINGNSSIGTLVRFVNQPASAAYNWQIGSNLTSGTSLEFQPSTAADGSTYTTSVMKISQAGNLVIAGTGTFSGAGNSSFVGNVGIGTTSPSRLLHVAGRFQLGGTAIATTDWALTSGWGANATISAVTGIDSRGTVTVTTSTLDTPSANPVITFTFKDGTWTTTPFCAVSMQHASTGPSTVPATCQATPTTLVLSYRGTPTATSALTYIFNYMVVG